MLSDEQRSQVESKIAEVTHRNRTTYWLIGLFGSVALMLGAFTIFVVRRTGKTEEALLNQGKRIRELYEVSSKAGLNIDEQISQFEFEKKKANDEIERTHHPHGVVQRVRHLRGLLPEIGSGTG